MAGRPHFMRQVTGFKERNYLIAALLHDPFEELAARLLFFNLLAKTKNPAPLMGFATGLLPLTEFARTLDFESEKSLTRAFRAASPETRALIRDPQTRMIACEPEERATRHHVTKALDLLSSMDVVGTRGRFSDFKAILADVLGADIIGDATMEPSPIVSKLADRLSRMSLVHNLLEQDLALYSYAEEAFELGFAAAAARA